MKLSEQWLRTWVNPEISTEELVQQLTMAGLEVDDVKSLAGDFSNVVVGEVLECEKHPNADRLRVCKVSTGDEFFNVVCGGKNVRANLKVPFAKIGATFGKDFTIKKSALRGVESEGMICSESELGLAEESDGIMELPHDAPLGEDIKKYLNLNDKVIDIDLTPNRGDCFSVIGIAREVAAINQMPLKLLENKTINNDAKLKFPVTVTAAEACPRYLGRVINNINMSAVTPAWLSERINRSGIRNINPVVDVMNYVMLELGQPMHTFDLDKVDKNIDIRLANHDEKLKLLNDNEISLTSNDLVIADHHKVLALAGIMGGLNSSVTDETKNIFLESAYFSAKHISGRARKFGLHTDSSVRFERGVDFQLQEKAIERATELLLEIVGGEAGEIIKVAHKEFLPEIKPIKLNLRKISSYLAIDLPKSEVKNILERLGMQINENPEGDLQVLPPSWRFDMTIEADLIEEIARIYGYDKIPEKLPKLSFKRVDASEIQIHQSQIRDRLTSRGFNEAITYTFIDEKIQKLFDAEAQCMKLANPIAEEMTVMRTNLWPGLVNAVLYNQRRQQERVRLFEIGQRFYFQNNELQQEFVISGIMTGSREPEQWAEKSNIVDFYDVKAVVENLLAFTNESEKVIFKNENIAGLLPGNCASIFFKGKTIGSFGALHPNIQKQMDVKGSVFLFEIALSVLKTAKLPKFKAISKFPSIRRDLAILINKEITAEQIQKNIKKAAGDLLTDLIVFDIYDGKGIEPGKKSVALGMILQHHERTLIDDEVNQIFSKVVNQLKKDYDALLRE